VYKNAILNIVPGGNLIGPGWFRAGTSEGPGDVNQTGGLLKLRVGQGTSRLVVGDAAGSAGSTYTISGGTITYDTTDGGAGDLCMGDRGGSGTFTVVGSAPVIQMKALLVGGRNSSRPATGNLEFKIGASGVSPIDVNNTVLDANGLQSTANLLVSLTADPPTGDVVLVRNAGTNPNSMLGIFDTVNSLPAPEGAPVALIFGGVTYHYTLTYLYDANGDGVNNDIALITKPLAPHTKWSQPPVEIDPNSPVPTYCGWDEQSWRAYPSPANWPIVADDFHCLGTMPVTSIHWWGSYVGWDGNEPPQSPSSAHEEWRIRFWSNVPAGMPFPFSWPEEMLWEIVIEDDRVQIDKVGNDNSPRPSDYNDTCFQYHVELEPNEVFWQDDFKYQTMYDTFWISIEALDCNSVCGYHWGWKTRPWHWMDDAVTMSINDVNVGETVDPCSNYITPIEYDGNSYDVSFELDTDPNYIKWEQLYTGIRHWPHYEDVNSMLDEQEPNDERLVADDWRCLRRTPVTAIVWWGSYVGYGYEPCSQPFMPVQPSRFKLSMWTDVPVSDPCNTYGYSHPGEIIWEYDASGYDEVLVGYDKHPLGGPNEPVFRYSVRLHEDEWFHQPDYNGVFWLSVQAIYSVNNTPNYIWGWTNHEHVFNDNAVSGYYDDVNEVWVWDEELYDQTGESEDMSFILFTDSNLCSTCANYNCDDRVNFVDFADFADDWRWVGLAGGYNNSDLDCNGIVDFKDLRVLCMQWLDSCPQVIPQW